MATATKKVLVVGSGGREHAFCWKLSQSDQVDEIYALPGSFGISKVKKTQVVKDVNEKDFKLIADWCKQKSIDLVVVGPEDPLANGIADCLNDAGIKCFGPCKIGAQIEADKKWAKDFMVRNGIPTAKFGSFSDIAEAKEYVKNTPNALVVKASGLATGKGVVVAGTIDEAHTAIDEILGNKKYGTAGDVIVIEEKLSGEEISVLAFVDGNTVRDMLPSQDHKRLKNNDQGPNTGGMGAYCPCPLISESDLEKVRTDILQKAVDGLCKENIKYCGVLYAGLMLTSDGPKCLEFNCRFGDPETQVTLPLLESDLFEVMLACCENRLSDVHLTWKENLKCTGVIMASAGYPETSTKGCIIDGLPSDTKSTIIFHSGVAVDSDGKFLTNGGRVLIVVCLSDNLQDAAMQATSFCDKITFSGKGAQYRTDIAQKAFKSKCLSYKDSGVDIDAGDDLVQRIKPLARGTARKGVVGGIGGFGGIFSINELSYKKPILCEVTKGVGAKIKIALDCELYDTIGYDLVAMCVNDVLESGAEPVGFLDYIACGKLQVPVAAQIIRGISEGCRDSHSALLGGETAEMPSVYASGKYDLAGYCLGILEAGNELPKFDKFEDGDLVVALPSNGLHCHGFDFVYNLVQTLGINLNDPPKFGSGYKTFGQELLQPSRIYFKELFPLIQKSSIKAISHITSGLIENLEKIVPPNFQANLNAESFPISAVYGFLAATANLSYETLLKEFNCGIGIVFIVSKTNTDWKLISDAVVVGEIKKKTCNESSVSIMHFENSLYKVSKQFISDKKNIISKDMFTKTDYKDTVCEYLNKTNRPETFTLNNGKRLTRLPSNYEDPILVIGTDGVGTKIKIAQNCNMNSTVGIDLVAMCANDILCNGAKPLTFVSYYACGQANVTNVKQITSGVVEGCKQANSALIDQEVVQVPLLYQKNVYDLAGFSLGITDRKNMLPRIGDIREGDIIIGIPSTGVHSNGFSLIHKIMEFAGLTFQDRPPFGGRKSFGEELLTPTQIYIDAITPLFHYNCIKALAHITGGGLIENIPRVLTKEYAAHLDAKHFDIPPIFAWLADNGNVTDYEMQRTFNCGIGMIIVCEPKYETSLLDNLKFAHRASKIGFVTKRKSSNEPQVVVNNFHKSMNLMKNAIKASKKRVAVLISGTGSNLQALIDKTNDSSYGICSEIVLVISNKEGVLGLDRANRAGIENIFISHRDFPSREAFDDVITKKLEEFKVDIICLAGYMRILSEGFVKKWKGKLINIHPSLLPKHPGLHVQKKALEAGDSESGCTVHFVDEGVDTGSIIVQERVPVLANDDVDSLSKRILKAEHYAFPKALKLLATNRVSLNEKGKCVFVY